LVPFLTPNEVKITYLDSVINTNEFVFLQQFSARTSSGRETWLFEAENADGNASRSYRLTIRKADSLLTYHSYSVLLQAPASQARARRGFLDAQDGLSFPGYAAYPNPSVQQLVDLVYLPTANRGFSLASPSDPTAKTQLGLAAWPSTNIRVTELRSTIFNETSFAAQDSEADLFNGFNAASPFPAQATNTGTLKEKQVVAFNTADNRKGLILVDDILDTVIPTVRLQVRVSKRALQ
jgi:hypothetical protein